MSQRARPTFAFMLSRPQHVLSLGFGAGLSPHMPGTVGAVLGFPLFWLIEPMAPEPALAAYAALFALGAWASAATGRALGDADHNAIVWDEVWGMALVLELGPAGALWWLPAFVLFRVFDIAKPWPLALVNERMKSGAGVMLDDALAAVYAIAVLHAAAWALARFAGA